MLRRFTLFLFLVFLSSYTFGETAREYFKFAKHNLDLSEYKKALVFVNKAIDIDPTYVSGFLLRAEINYGLEDYSGVIDDVSHAFKLDEEAGKTMDNFHLLRGDAHYKLNKLEEAMTDLNNCIKLNPKSARAYYLKAIINTEELKYFEAVENFDYAIRFDSDESDFYYKRAELKKLYYKPLFGTDTYESIMKDINLSLALNPDDYRPYKLRCDMLKLDKNYKKEDLIAELDKYIDSFPEQSEFYAERGLANVLNYNYGLAVKDFTKAIHFDELNEANFRNRGLCFHNMKRYQLAMNDYSKSIDILIRKYQASNSDDNLKKLLAQTFNMRGRSNALNGNSDLACDDYYNAAKLGSNTGLNNYRKNCNVFN